MHTLKIKRTDFQVRPATATVFRKSETRGSRLTPEVEVWPACCSELGEEVQQSEGDASGSGEP